MAKEKNPYKDTLNLPRTDFDMRAGLLKKEPVFQKRWREQDLYGRIRAARQGRPRFVLHDGPPYANGNIHMGTALNKVLKDIVVKYRTMCGLDAPYVPGWDCHGLPIEQKVMDAMQASIEAVEPMQVRRRCREYAQKYSSVQSEQFQRLGVLGEFDDPYITMNPRYEASTLEVFARLVEAGLVRRQLKPVHWSIENRTALADAELEYHDRQDPSIYVCLAVEAGEGAWPEGWADAAPLHLMVWTTTPWTLPANEAVAMHPDFEYALVQFDGAAGPVHACLAAERVEAVLAALAADEDSGLSGGQVVATCRGKALIDSGLRYRHPLVEGKNCPVVSADYVTLEDGTGLVHTAPGHGLEDYLTGRKYDLPVSCPVGEDGLFDDSAPQLVRGQDVWTANGTILKHLRQQGTLAACRQITHSYPHDWRSKTPTIFRATEQWFISVDSPLTEKATLREMALNVVDDGEEGEDAQVRFLPAWGRNRMAGMLQSRPDWCISRQRAWGLPIPAFTAPDGRTLLTAASVRAVAQVFAEEGSDAWFTRTPAELLRHWDAAADPEIDDPAAFEPDALTAGRDIFDVWFESGSSWHAVVLARGLCKDIPVDLYLEGSDQHRGWFQLSLLPALGSRGVPPFKTVLTHGFVVTEDGHKMSKSLGNAIDVVEQLDRRGADILRLWIASQNYQDDVRCSESLIAQAEDAYRKIRNTLRFCMGSCFDFDPATDAVEPLENSLDQWMLMELHMLIRDVREAFDAYEFHRAARRIYEFCTVQASSIYLSAVKDRLYCESPAADRRRSSQTVIHRVLVALVKLLAPILPHTCEEAWEHIPGRDADESGSVHLALLPEYDREVLELADDLRPVSPDQLSGLSDSLQAGPAWIWRRVLDLRDEGLGRLETLRNEGVKNPLDAEAVLLYAEDDAASRQLLETFRHEIEDLLGVGHARLEASDDLKPGSLSVEVRDARELYPRCARSWKRRPDVGSNPEYPELCARDAAVMAELSAGS